MQDIQLRKFEEDYMLVLRSHKATKGKPTQIDLLIILPGTTETRTISVTLTPNKTVDHLREELQGELRHQQPRTFQDVGDLIAVIRSKTPRLFIA